VKGNTAQLRGVEGREEDKRGREETEGRKRCNCVR
jgi:hypothetical protein